MCEFDHTTYLGTATHLYDVFLVLLAKLFNSYPSVGRYICDSFPDKKNPELDEISRIRLTVTFILQSKSFILYEIITLMLCQTFALFF